MGFSGAGAKTLRTESERRCSVRGGWMAHGLGWMEESSGHGGDKF